VSTVRPRRPKFTERVHLSVVSLARLLIGSPPIGLRPRLWLASRPSPSAKKKPRLSPSSSSLAPSPRGGGVCGAASRGARGQPHAGGACSHAIRLLAPPPHRVSLPLPLPCAHSAAGLGFRRCVTGHTGWGGQRVAHAAAAGIACSRRVDGHRRWLRRRCPSTHLPPIGPRSSSPPNPTCLCLLRLRVASSSAGRGRSGSARRRGKAAFSPPSHRSSSDSRSLHLPLWIRDSTRDGALPQRTHVAAHTARSTDPPGPQPSVPVVGYFPSPRPALPPICIWFAIQIEGYGVCTYRFSHLGLQMCSVMSLSTFFGFSFISWSCSHFFAKTFFCLRMNETEVWCLPFWFDHWIEVTNSLFKHKALS